MLMHIAQQVVKWVHTLARLNKLISFVTLCVMGILTTTDVIGCYLFHQSIEGSYEIIQALMLVLVYTIFAFVAEVDFNVRVDILFVRFSKRVQARMDIFHSLGSIFIMALVTWRLGSRTWAAFTATPIQEWLSYSVQWPFWPFAALATIGCGVLVLELILWFFSSIKNAWLKS